MEVKPGLTLRPYQVDGIRRLSSMQRVILGDEMGLGKTAQTVLALKQTFDKGPILIVAPKRALWVWERELLKWADEESVILEGNRAQREAKLNSFNSGCARFLIMNPAILKSTDLNRRWSAIVYDESHDLRNRKNGFDVLAKLRSEGLFLLSGTPIVRGAQDLFAPLHLINSAEFRSYWQFIYRHFHVIKDTFGNQIEGLKNPEAFRQMLRRYMIRRTKAQVFHELPNKIRQSIPIQMSREQKRIYKELAEELLADLGEGNVIAAPTHLAAITRLRQLLVSPALLGGKDDSVAMDTLQDMVDDSIASDRAVAVFTPFASAFPTLQNRLQKRGRLLSFIQGGLSPTEFKKRITEFQDAPTANKVAICTIKTATSFDLTAASVGIFVGYEWTPLDNLQAEDRLHRGGQSRGVNIYYLLHRETVDERVMEVLDDKNYQAHLVLQPKVSDLFG